MTLLRQVLGLTLCIFTWKGMCKVSGISRVFLYAIQWYQRYISPHYGRRCRFHPTCSEYARLAIAKYGWWKGGWKTVNRLRRCNPRYQGNKIDYP
jgi:putative membrane protein insertion efficiency factor